MQTEVQKDAGRAGARAYAGYKLAAPLRDEDDERDETEDDDVD